MPTWRSPCSACPASRSTATTAKDAASRCVAWAAISRACASTAWRRSPPPPPATRAPRPTAAAASISTSSLRTCSARWRSRKTASASTDEGSLGATVDLVTGKPLDYKGTEVALSAGRRVLRKRRHAQPAHRRIGCRPVLRRHASACRFRVPTANATSEVDRYKRQAGQSDYEYRGSTFAGTLQTPRAGFAAPAGASSAGTVRDERRAESRGDRRADRIGSRRLCVAVSGCAVQHPGSLQQFAGAHSRTDEHRTAGPRRRSASVSPAQSSGSRPKAPTSASTWCIRSSIRRAT